VQPGRWSLGFTYRKESVRTTWTFRLALVALFVILGSLTRGWWVPAIGRGLICDQSNGRSDVPTPRKGDALLVENFDLNYLVFERASELMSKEVAPRALVPTDGDPESGQLNMVSAGIVDVMVRVARLPGTELIPIQAREPITLNTAYQLRAFLEKEHLRSIVVVVPALRSRRSILIYNRVFGEAGITTSCVPVFGQDTPDTWASTWHGIQQVIEQYGKLAYYRFYVLPSVSTRRAA
jgi:hypothetical protein